MTESSAAEDVSIPPLKVELSENYYSQHRNVLIFSVLLVAVNISGAHLESSQDTYAGTIKFTKELNISLILVVCLLYSFLHFCLEWAWQARQQYNFGLQEMESIEREINLLLVPLRNSISDTNARLETSIGEFSTVSQELVEEHRNPPESKMTEFRNSMYLLADDIKRYFSNHAPMSPHDMIDYENATLTINERRATKQQIVQELYVLMSKYRNIHEYHMELLSNIESFTRTENDIFEDLKRRARQSAGNIEQLKSDYESILGRYESLSIPRSVRGQLRRARFASGAITWGIGLIIPTVATATALLTTIFPSFSNSLSVLFSVAK